MTFSPKAQSSEPTPYVEFSRDEWKKLRKSTPLTLTQEELEEIKGINENISLEEVTDIYLPISRLLHLYYGASRSLYEARHNFLDTKYDKIPFIMGIAGSVAVGKSTTSRLLKTLISAWPESPRVDLISTDGFIYPNKVLQERDLMNRKGFPESFNIKQLISFLYDVKSGVKNLKVPLYSHLIYDIIPGEFRELGNSDILLLEGLNVLQTKSSKTKYEPELFVSDFFDFSVYIDAEEQWIKRWYIDRFKVFMKTSFADERSYFHSYSKLSEMEAESVAGNIWDTINAVNLRENILTTKYHAHLILEKSLDHSICKVFMRKI